MNMTYSVSKSTDDVKSIVVVHRHTLIREGITKILQEAGFHVVGQADSGRSLLQLLAQHNPNIILVDWEISGVNSDTIRGLTEKWPRMKVGGGWLSVSHPLISKVRARLAPTLARGDIIVSQEMVNGVKEELAAAQTSKPEGDISGRERDVLRLVSRGATNREIAERLIVSEHTVKVHLRNILNKLNLRNRQQIAAYAVQEGLVTDIKSEDPSGASP